MKDLIDAAKAKPGVLNYASVGPGSPAHLTFELLKKRTGIDLLHVPFKGTNESLPAMFAGDIHAMFDTLPLALPHIQAGKLRALAVTTLQRVPQLPDVPTLKELSLGDDEVVTWYARDRARRHAAADHRPALQGIHRRRRHARSEEDADGQRPDLHSQHAWRSSRRASSGDRALGPDHQGKQARARPVDI